MGTNNRYRRRRRRRVKPWVKYAGVILLILAILLIIFLLFGGSKTKRIVKMEAGTAFPEISTFLKKEYKKESSFVTDISSVDTHHIGKTKIKIKVGKRTFTSTLKVIDTTAPKADPVNPSYVKGDPVLTPKDYIKNVNDAAAVTAEYKSKPNYRKVGNQEVIIILKDQSGNKSEVVNTLSVLEQGTVTSEEETPIADASPLIEGAADITVKVGGTVAYKSNITLSDDKDDPAAIQLDIDNSSVDLSTPGTYPVTYKATDTDGNVTTLQINVIVEELSEEEEYVYAECQKRLDSIINDNMNDLDKLYAIYYYVHYNIKYVNGNDRDDPVKATYNSLKKGTGDCYNYFAMAKIMLDLAGFENIDMERVDDTHFWNIVKYDGKWYHFDSCPHDKNYAKYKTFMLTDSEAQAFGKWIGRDNYYEYKTDGIPEITEDSINFNGWKLPTQD